MNTVKSIMLAVLVVGSSIAMADNNATKFNKHQHQMLRYANQETQIINQFQRCLTVAQKTSALKNCNEVKKDDMKKVWQSMQESDWLAAQ